LGQSTSIGRDKPAQLFINIHRFEGYGKYLLLDFQDFDFIGFLEGNVIRLDIMAGLVIIQTKVF